MDESQSQQAGSSETVRPMPEELSGVEPANSTQTTPQSGGLDEKLAAFLSYVLGFVTGIIFLLTDKREFVRFHAAQSTVFFLIVAVVTWLLPYTIVLAVFVPLIGLFSLVMWIIFMLKAYQGERLKLPLVGDWAEKLAGQVKPQS